MTFEENAATVRETLNRHPAHDWHFMHDARLTRRDEALAALDALLAEHAVLREAANEARRLLDEEANGTDPEPVVGAWNEHYKAYPSPPVIASIYDIDAYEAQEKAWEILCEALGETP